jgi:hypothetical protein
VLADKLSSFQKSNEACDRLTQFFFPTCNSLACKSSGAKLERISIDVILHNQLVSLSIAKSFSLIIKGISANPLVSFDTNGYMLAPPLQVILTS